MCGLLSSLLMNQQSVIILPQIVPKEYHDRPLDESIIEQDFKELGLELPELDSIRLPLLVPDIEIGTYDPKTDKRTPGNLGSLLEFVYMLIAVSKQKTKMDARIKTCSDTHNMCC